MSARSPFMQLMSLRDDEPVRARDLKAWAEWIMSQRSTVLQFAGAAATATTRRLYQFASTTAGSTSLYPSVLVPYDGVIRNFTAANTDNSGTDTDTWTATLLKRSASATAWTTTGVTARVSGNTSMRPVYGGGQLKVAKGDLLAVEVTYSGTITGLTGAQIVSMELAAV